MKLSSSDGRPRQHRTNPGERAELLDAFERSGLSVAAFARKCGIRYGTFDAWRRQQRKAAPGFVRVEGAPAQASAELVIEFGAGARLHLASVAQVALAARLLQALNSRQPC